MSPKIQVLPLSYICLKYVSNVLVQCLCDEEGVNYEAVEDYLLDATQDVLQDLLKIILGSENMDASIRFSCLQLILREEVKKLETGVFPHTYYERLLDVVEVRGVGLQHLNLKGVWLRDYPERLVELLLQLKQLRVLIIPHMPDDCVLEAAMKCKQLTVLDISGECNFTRDGLKKIRSDNLKVLSIGMYGKRNICEDNSEDDAGVVAALIRNLPNLHALKTYSFAGEALQEIFNQDSNHKTNLRYIHDTDTTPSILEAITSTCPDLESVNFNAPRNSILSKMCCLKRLSCVKISELNTTELLTYLEMYGDKIQVLKLSVTRGDTLDISQLCVLAPELNTLECYKCRIICLNLDNYFINLQSVEILYCDISDSVLKYLLQNSPFLRRVVVGDVIRMTDGDVFRLCAECDFHALEELWFSCARGLTATSVELLMGHCPNLKVLGQLTGWDVSSSDLDYLRAVILSTNTDLTLLPLETSM